MHSRVCISCHCEIFLTYFTRNYSSNHMIFQKSVTKMDRKYECTECSYKSESIIQAINHIKGRHPKLTTCPCGKSYNTRRGLLMHISARHGFIPKDTPAKRCLRLVCQALLPNSIELKEHYKKQYACENK